MTQRVVFSEKLTDIGDSGFRPRGRNDGKKFGAFLFFEVGEEFG